MSTRQVVKIPMEVQMSIKNSTDELRRVAEAMQKQFENIDLSTPFGKQYGKIINQIQKGFASIDASTLGSELFDESDFKRVASYVERIDTALQNLRVHGTSGTARQLGLDITAIEEAEEKLKRLKKAKEEYAKTSVGALEPAELSEFEKHKKDTGFSASKTYKSNIYTLTSKRGVVKQQLEELKSETHQKEKAEAEKRVKEAEKASEQAKQYYEAAVKDYEQAKKDLPELKKAKESADKALEEFKPLKYKADVAQRFKEVRYTGTTKGGEIRRKADVIKDFNSIFESEIAAHFKNGKLDSEGQTFTKLIAEWLNYNPEQISALMRKRADNIVAELRTKFNDALDKDKGGKLNYFYSIAEPIVKNFDKQGYADAENAVIVAQSKIGDAEAILKNGKNLKDLEAENTSAKTALDAAKATLKEITDAETRLTNLSTILDEQIKKLDRLSQEFDASANDKFNDDIQQATQEVAEASDAAVQEVRDALAASAEDSNVLNKGVRSSQRGFTAQQDELKRINDEQERAEKAAEKEAADFKKELSASIKHWMSAQQIINVVKDGIRQAYQDIKALDSAMTNIAVVTDMSISDLWGKINEYMSIAKQYGVTTQGVYEVSQLYYQQGLSTNEVMAATTETLKMARIAGMDYKDAADAMTVAIRAFKMEMTDAEHVTDVYSKVAAVTASDSEELAIAMSKTASSAESVGSSFENTTAMLAVMIETTRESAQNLGSALKSIISRYGEMKIGLTVDSEGEEIDYNKVDTALKSVGISIKDAQGQFRDFDDVIFELSKKWDGLDKNTQRYIATIMAGNRQQSRFIALVDNWERLDEVSAAAADSADAGLLQYAKTLDSLDTKLNTLKTNFQQFYMSIFNGEFFKGAVDIINNFVTSISRLGPILGTINLIKLINQIKLVGQLLINTFSSAIQHVRKANKDWQDSFTGGWEGVGDKITDTILKRLMARAKDTGRKFTEGVAKGAEEAKNNMANPGNTSSQNNPISNRKYADLSGLAAVHRLAANSTTSNQVVKQSNLLFGLYGLTQGKGYFAAAENILQDSSSTKIDQNWAREIIKAKQEYQAAIKANTKDENGRIQAAKKAQQAIDAANEKRIKAIEQSTDAIEEETKGSGIKGWLSNKDNRHKAGQAAMTIGTLAQTVALGKDTSKMEGYDTQGWFKGLGGATTAAGQILTGNVLGGIITAVTTVADLWNHIVNRTQVALENAQKAAEEANIERAQKKEESENLKSTINNLKKLQAARYDSEEAMQAYLEASDAAIEKYPELANTIDANGRKMADVLMNTTQSEQLLLEARKAAAQATYKAAIAERNKIAAEISLREQNKKAYNNFKDVDYSMDQFWDPSYLFIQQNQGQDDLISGLGISTEDAFNITRAIYDTNSDLYKNIVIAAEKEGITVAQKQQELDKYIFGLIGSEKDIVGANSTNAYEALQYHDALFDSQVDQQYSSSLIAGNRAAIRDKATEYFVDKRAQTEPAWQDVDWLSNLAASYVESNLDITNNDFDANGLSGAGLNKINESTKLVDAELDQFYLQHAEDLDEIYDLITQASQGKISKNDYIEGLKNFGIVEDSFIYKPLMDQYYQQDNNRRAFYANAILGEGAVSTYEEFLKDETLTDSASARATYNEQLRQTIRDAATTNGIYLAEFVANASEQQLQEYLAITKEYVDAESIVGPSGEVAKRRLAWMQKIYTGEYKDTPGMSDYSVLSPEAQAEFFRLLNTNAGTHKWAEDLNAFERQYGVELGNWDEYAFENFSIRTQNIIDNAVSVTDTIKEIGEKHNKGFSWEESQKLLKQIQAIDPSATWTGLFKTTEDGFVVLKDANETMQQLYQKQSDDLDKQQATIDTALSNAQLGGQGYKYLTKVDWKAISGYDEEVQANFTSDIVKKFLGVQDPELEAQILAGIQSGAIYSYETLIAFLEGQQETLEAAGLYVDSQLNNTLAEQKVNEIQQTTIDVIESIFNFIQKAIEGTLSATDLYDMGKAIVSSGTMSADEWHTFASQNISRVGTGYKMNEAAAFALQVNTGNYDFESLVDQFDSIEEVNEMLKELGENSEKWGNEFVRAAERVLESIKMIKAQDPGDAMFNWMDQDMEGWAGTYEASLNSIGKAGEVINASMESGTMGLSDFYNMSQIVGQYLAKPGNESLVGAWTQYRNAVYDTATAVDGGTVSVVASTDGMLDALGLMTQATESYYNDLAKQQIAFIDKQIATLEAQKAVEEALSGYNGGYDMDGDGAPDYSPDNYKEIYDNAVITEKERDNLGRVQQGATGYDIDEEAAKLAYYKNINNITDKQWDALTYQDQQNARAEALKVDEDDYQKWFVNQFIPRMDEIMKAASAAGLDLADPAVVQSLADTALARMGVGGYGDIFSNSEELDTLTNIKTSVANIEKAVVPEASSTSDTNSEERSAGAGEETTTGIEQPPITTQKFEGKSYAAVAMGDTGPIFSTPSLGKREIIDEDYANLVKTQHNLEITEQSLGNVTKELDNKIAELNEAQATIVGLEAELVAVNKRITILQQQLLDEKDSHQQTRDELDAEREGRGKEAEATETMLQAKDAEIQNYKALLDNAGEKYSTLLAERDALQTSKDALNKDLENAQKRIAYLESSIDFWVSHTTKLNSEIGTLKADKRELLQQIFELQGQILYLQEQTGKTLPEQSSTQWQEYSYQTVSDYFIELLDGSNVEYQDDGLTLTPDSAKYIAEAMAAQFGELDWRTLLTNPAITGSYEQSGQANRLLLTIDASFPLVEEGAIVSESADLAKMAAEGFQSELDNTPANISVNATTNLAQDAVNRFRNNLKTQKGYTAIVVDFVNPDGTKLDNNVLKAIVSQYSAEDGSSNATGNVNGLAFATGTEKLIAGANLANKSLVGELGPELAVYNGQYHLLGANGAEFANIPSDAIIFNHKQTESILKGQANIRGRVKDGGEAFAEGNVSGPAYASGIDKAIAALQEARAMWQSLLDTPLDKIIGRNKASGGGSGISAVDIGELEEWYNLLRQIEAIQDDINLLIAERNNLEAEYNGEATLRNLRQQQSLLEKQQVTQEQLMEYQRIQLERQKNEILNDPVWNKFLTFDESTGAIQYTKGNELFGGKGAWEFLQDLDQMSAKEQIAAVNKLGYTAKDKEGKQLTGEELVKHFVDAAKNIEEEYRNLDNTVRESETELENINSNINEIEQTIRDNEIALEQNVFDTIVDAWEANIDALEEQKDLIEEANDAYVEGLREALDAERKAYEDEASLADREQLQRELSLLRRSGGSASEIADLEEQIDNALKDEYFKSQEDMIAGIEEANKNQIELLEKQIKIEEETLEYQKENGVIWQQVATILSGTKESIMAFLSGSAPGFFAQSKNQQVDALNEWSYMVGLYKEDQFIKNTSAQALNDMNSSDGKMGGHTDMSGYYEKFSGSEMTDEERKSAADAYATEYAKLLSEGKTEEQAAEGARKVLRDRIDQYSTPAPKGGDIEPPKIDNGDNNEVRYDKISCSVSASPSYAGSPSLSTKTAKPNQLVTVSPNSKAGWSYDYYTVNGKRKEFSGNTGSFKPTGSVSSVKVVVYYQSDSGEETGNLPNPNNLNKYGYEIKEMDTNKTITKGEAIYATEREAYLAANSDPKRDFAKNYVTTYAKKAYKTGGLVDYTGLAMVHGSSSKPEAFLNAEQTAQIKDALMLQTKEGLLSSLQDSLLKFQSTIDGTVSGITSEANNSSINIQPGAVIIQVEELANNYDVEKLSNDVMNRMTAIAAKATNRGVNRR